MFQFSLSNDILTLFFSQILVSLPFLLLGIFVSSILLVFVDEHKLIARFPQNQILSSLVGSSLGLLLPVGQYGTIPVVRRLLLQGAPIPLAISFLVAGPTVNPLIIWLTLSKLSIQPRLVFLRIVLTWLMGVIIALVFSSYREKPSSDLILNPLNRVPFLRSGTFLEDSEKSDPLHRSGNLIYEYARPEIHLHSAQEKLGLFFINGMRESLELIPILCLGCAIAAGIQVYLPQASLLNWAADPLIQVLLMMVLGVILSLGSIASISFLMPLMGNLWMGSSLAFLLIDSVINLKSLALLLAVFRFRPVFYLTILASQLTLLFALGLNFYIN